MPAVRFCSACGAPLPSQPPVTCAACGTSHWRNPKPCANAIVVEDERVLLVRRAHAPWHDAWCSPGGFCDLGEHPIETVEREVREEAGRRVEVIAYLGVWVSKYADEPGDEDADVINVAYYLAAPVDGTQTAVDSTEVSEVAWFGWDALPTRLAPPGTLEEILRVARDLVAGRRAPLGDRPP